jgi:Peptidase family S41
MRLMLALTLMTILTLIASPLAAQSLDDASRRQVLERTAALVDQRYVDAARGRRIAQAIRADAKADRFAAIADPVQFASALEARLRSLSNDLHFAVDYRSLSASPASEEVIADEELQRWYGPHVNHGFERIERLQGAIGYLDLRVFAPTDVGGDLATSAMSLLAQSPALIIDLRRNGGGMGDMALLLAAYLLNGSTEMSGTYDRPTDRHIRSFTPSWVPGRRFGATKPVYILVSRRTFSAAEGFAYDLQALRRATIVGEPTGGGAHPFEYRSINDRFTLSLPEGRSINPITGGDWQGKGVQPDVAVPADQALERALALALAAIQGNAATNGLKAR